MVLANNAIRLREIQANIIDYHAIFNNVHQVSQSTLAHSENTSGSDETVVPSAFCAEFRAGQTAAASV